MEGQRWRSGAGVFVDGVRSLLYLWCLSMVWCRAGSEVLDSGGIAFFAVSDGEGLKTKFMTDMARPLAVGSYYGILTCSRKICKSNHIH
jgi:hypothetical protein